MSISSLSPLDGRYSKNIDPLKPYFSEWGLIKYRIQVEIEWLIMMSEEKEITHVRGLTEPEKAALRKIAAGFDQAQAKVVKEIEEETRHDVKAVEYYIKRAIKGTSAEGLSESIHFCCTSEDINNLAHALMLKNSMASEWLPAAEEMLNRLGAICEETADIPMLARTHGQAATPTTTGKELAVFIHRWKRQLSQIRDIEFLGKFNGAVGCYNAHAAAYPFAPWEDISGRFVQRLGLKFNPLTTQIESHDYMAELFHALIRFNNILMDFNRDMWAYISLGYFRQKVVSTEVGSSVMPHKVNPIDFENSEANIGISNALLEHLASKLQVSRLQRDLTDSSAIRNAGSAIGHSYLAIKSAARGIDRVLVDRGAILNDLTDAWEVLAEPIQTVMRKAGIENPYERMKTLSRGKRITREDLHAFINGLELAAEDKKRLLDLTPVSYTGLASSLVKHIK
ncbi:MAG: adenylosuccinate lyase [Deltaproteobacteria bacterium]|nr:adenylosuccinate lyase [Deltaproteobacteria bacterium]